MSLSRLAGVLAISAGLVVLQPATGFAAPIPNTTITFNDTTDILTITTTPSGAGAPTTINSSCTVESCTIDVLDPATASGSSLGGVAAPIDILDQGGSVISDTLDASHQNFLSGFTGGYVVTFTSDTDEVSGLGIFTSGNSLIEDGTVQNPFTITWNDNTGAIVGTATIQFQSDVETTTGVPEPLTISVFGAGLAGAMAMRRRRKTRSERAQTAERP